MASILIKNAYIVSMVSPISKADILVKDNKIQEIGMIEEKADRVIDATGKVIMPGLVNAHTHVAMSIFRGYSDELELMEWLSQKIWPIEDKMNGKDVFWASMLSMIEMIKSGTTTFNDHYFFEEETARAAVEIGMRAILARCVIGDGEGAEKRFQEAEKLYRDWHQAGNGRIQICVGLHAPYTCPPEVIKKGVELAKKLQIPFHIHYLETEDETHQIQEKYGKTVTDYLKDCGIDQVKSILAHGVQMTEEDMEILKSWDTAIIHNPISNQKLGSGIAPIKKMLEVGLTVGLGTDGQGSTNTLDMFEEIKSAAYLQKVTKKSATAISGYDVLKMATIEGAKALGLEKEIGSLEVGKKADIIMIDLNKPHLIPVHDIYSTLAYSVNGADVEMVMIDGKIVMENREMLTVDEDVVKKQVNQVVNHLFQEE